MASGTGAATVETPTGMPEGRERKRNQNRLAEERLGLYLVLPTLLLLGVVILYPVVKAIVMSFQKDAGIDPATGMFVEGGSAGFSNYTHWLLQQCSGPGGTTVSCPPGSLGAQFWPAFWVTIFFTVVTVILETILGVWFAMIMNRKIRGRGLLRAAILIPWAIPTAVTAKLAAFCFAFAGVVNAILHADILWTGEEWPARFAIILTDVWKTTPFMALLILAGLQTISADVYEAANVDGATKWQQFTKITLPLVRPALIVAVLFRTLDVLRMYDLPAILTGGANGTTTLSILVVEQIRQGFNSAAALSTLTFLLVFFVAFLFIKFLGANVTADHQPKLEKVK